MSRRFFLNQRIIAKILALTLATQSAWVPGAHANEADTFIAKTNRLAEGIATSQMNFLMLGALQDASGLTANLDVEKAYSAMKTQGALIRGNQATLNRLYAVATDTKSSLTGRLMSQLYSDYTTMMSRIATQKLTLDGIRREGYAYRGVLYRLSENFVKNLDQTCKNGLYANPYDQIWPSLQALMTPYEIKLSLEIGGDGHPKYDPEHSGISLGKSDEEKAIWALAYAGNVILSAYILTGTWYVSGATFSALSAGTQLAALGMGLGFTAAIAAVIIVAQIISSREKAAEEVRKQRQIFENRADENTVNALFTRKCLTAKNQFAGLMEDLQALSKGDEKAAANLEKSRTVQMAKLKEFSLSMEAYMKKQVEIFGGDFDRLPAEEKIMRKSNLQASQESKKFLEVSSSLSPDDMAGMLGFVLKDLYYSGVKYSTEVERAFQEADKIYKSGRAEQRAAALRELASEKNLSEMSLKSSSDLQAEMKQSLDLAALYADLDAFVIDYARTIFTGVEDLAPSLQSLDERLSELRTRARGLSQAHPGSELAGHLTQRLNQVKAVTAKEENL